MSVHLERAKVLVDLGRQAEAEEELRRALAEEPSNSEAHRLLAWCLARQRLLPQAQTEAEEAIRLQPDYAAAHCTLGLILLHQCRWKEAEKAIREAIRLCPQDADHFFLLAVLFSQQKRWNECEEAAREGLRLDPDNLRCANILVEALLEMTRTEEAQDVLRVAIAKNPENDWAHFNQGLIYERQKNIEASLHHFHEAARLDPEDTNVHKYIKRLQEQLQKHPLAWTAILPIIYFILKLIVVLMHSK